MMQPPPTPTGEARRHIGCQLIARRRLRKSADHIAPCIAHTLCAQPAAAAADVRTHTERDDPPGAAAAPGGPLTACEIEFFKANGFLVKRRLIPEAALGPVSVHTSQPHLVAMNP